MPNVQDHITIKLVNSKEHLELLQELIPAVQNKVVYNALRSSANIILAQAKQNFKASKKNKSKTNYKNLNKSFTTEPLKSRFGLKVGIKNYKMKWLEFGTDDRYYKAGKKRYFRYRKSLVASDKNKHYVGKIQPTHFFFSAVQARKSEAEAGISDAIIKSLERTVSRYNKKYAIT